MKRPIYVFLLVLFLLACTASAQNVQGSKCGDALRHYSTAYEYMKQGNYEKARELLTKAIEDSTTYVDAYIALRKVYINLGDINKAIEICMLGLSCVLEKIGENVKDVEEELIEANRKLTLALADLYAKIGEPEKADEFFEKIIKDDPKDANSWDLYAYYHYKQGRIDEAIEYYNKAYQLDPENKGIAFRLGDAYFAAGRYKDAVGLFTKVKETFPEDIDIMKKTAESYYNLHEYKKAIEEYKAIVELAPKHVSSRIQIGNAYRELKQYEKAKEYYHEALEIESNNLSVYYQLINLELGRKNLNSVKKYLDEAFKIYANDPILFALYGEYYYRLGIEKMSNKEWNPSIERYEKAIEIWQATIKKAYDPEWKEYARKGIERAEKMIEEVKKVRW